MTMVAVVRDGTVQAIRPWRSPFAVAPGVALNARLCPALPVAAGDYRLCAVLRSGPAGDERPYTQIVEAAPVLDGAVVRIAAAYQDLPLDAAKAQARRRVKAARDRRIAGGLDWSPDGGATMHAVQTDETSLSRIAQQAAALAQFGAAEVRWRMAGNATVTLSAADFLALARAVHDHVQAAYASQAALETDIAAADTLDALRALNLDGDFDAGW